MNIHIGEELQALTNKRRIRNSSKQRRTAASYLARAAAGNGISLTVVGTAAGNIIPYGHNVEHLPEAHDYARMSVASWKGFWVCSMNHIETIPLKMRLHVPYLLHHAASLQPMSKTNHLRDLPSSGLNMEPSCSSIFS